MLLRNIKYLVKSFDQIKNSNKHKQIFVRRPLRVLIIRSFKALGCPNIELLVVLREQIISICEVCVAWWGPNITIQESYMLKIVLNAGLHIFFKEI